MYKKFEKLQRDNLDKVGFVGWTLMFLIGALYYNHTDDMITAGVVGIGGGAVVLFMGSFVLGLLCSLYDGTAGSRRKDKNGNNNE